MLLAANCCASIDVKTTKLVMMNIKTTSLVIINMVTMSI